MLPPGRNRGRRQDQSRLGRSHSHQRERDYELRYWTAKFGCTTTELKAAVAAVGVMADKVEAHLKQGKR